MKKYYAAVAVGLASAGLAGCKSQTIETRLPAEALAWQPYQAGQVLRFGQASTSQVRTYIIGDVHDELIQYSRGGNAPVYLGPPTKYRTQMITVSANRTDTVRYVRTGASTAAKPDSVLYTGGTTLLSLMAADDTGNSPPAYLGWDIGFECNFPLSEVVVGQAPADTAQQLLPTLRLGGVTYGPVLRLANQLAPPTGPYVSFPRNKPARRVYYAKGVGVVGFVEGSTLWYLLP
ncbi:hypothetical protein [Hymenobacter cheonanensis]|uniref:hypothetical protein n=1 Tax=Hymenobacter sp. CA2-7 TaxID=3063993 RepID=UPI002712FA9F|nr:hypothetical protein [Hymenobacter sp. CA2-7]MDO7887374.1 hypothetical protein [Hymenobacter sp. CA2-7]